MKKILAILGAFGMTATGATAVVACKKGDNSKDTLGGLKASDFEKALNGVADKTALNNKVIQIITNKVTDKTKNKKIADNISLFEKTFVVTYKFADGVSFPLAKDKKITLTIKKSTDDQIKAFYKETHSDTEIPAVQLTLAKKIQGYVSGTEFLSEITIKENTKTTVDVSSITVTKIANPLEITVSETNTVKKPELDGLNSNAAITESVLAAIKAVKDVPQDVALGTDYTIINNGKPDDFSTAKKVTFTVTTKGDKISGTFTFDVNVKGIKKH